MKIKERCLCGAKFEGFDPARTLISDDGKLDENGDKFVIEKSLREFRAAHYPCLLNAQRVVDSEETDG